MPCNGATGARFNLEPRANALPQQSEAADFLLNGVGAGEDLIVQSERLPRQRDKRNLGWQFVPAITYIGR